MLAVGPLLVINTAASCLGRLPARRSKLAAVQEEIEAMGETKAVERANLVKVDPLPDKARRQSEAVAAILKSVQVNRLGRE